MSEIDLSRQIAIVEQRIPLSGLDGPAAYDGGGAHLPRPSPGNQGLPTVRRYHNWEAVLLPAIEDDPAVYCAIVYATVNGTIPTPVDDVEYPDEDRLPPHTIAVWDVAEEGEFTLLLSGTNAEYPDPPDAWEPSTIEIHYGATPPTVDSPDYGTTRPIAVVNEFGRVQNNLTRSLEAKYCPGVGILIGGL